MNKILYKIILRQYKEVWEAWKMYLYIKKLEFQTKTLTQILSMRNLAVKLNIFMCRFLRRIIKYWIHVIKEEREYLLFRKKSYAATVIQKYVKRRLAMKYVRILRDQKKYQHVLNSLILIQSLFRMKPIRWRYKKESMRRKRNKAAIEVQKIIRAKLARKLFFVLVFENKIQKSATSIQSVIRRKLAQEKIKQMKLLQLQVQCAIIIQAFLRRCIVRCRMYYAYIEQLKYICAIKIQSAIRRKLVYMHLHYYKQMLYRYRYERDFFAARMQSLFRMFRVRKKYLLYVEYVKSERLKIYNAATRINNFCRCAMARQMKKHLFKERYEWHLYNARMWQEHWSDTDNAWYYVNVETGESAWEPPTSGYTTAYQKLVHSSGELIDDPLLLGGENGLDGKSAIFLMCGECLKRHATQKCEQCRTNFCTLCIIAVHKVKTKLNHIFTPTGLVDCSECETAVAKVFCKTCDEAFCGDCCTKVHAKGNRKFHIFSEL